MVTKWFWSTLQEFTNSQRAALLKFATGASILPPGGFRALRPVFR
jgi:hypothetical protein